MSVSQGEEHSEAPAVAQPDGEGVSGEGVSDGGASSEGASSQAGGPVRTLDFSQPTKFTTELRRRIGRALELFCDGLGAWMAVELKAEVEVALIDVSQHTWAAAKAQLPADAVAVAVEAESIERNMLLSVQLPLVLQSLECLLGGEAAQAPAERHLTEIDWVLTRGVLDAMVNQLSVAWDELGGTELTRGEVDIEGDAGVLTPIGEPTLSVTLEAKIDGLASTVSLLIPWGAIEPITNSIRGAGSEQRSSDPLAAEALRRGVAGAQVLLRAEVGSVQMPIERMLDLTPGALLELEDGAEDGVLLFAEGVSLGRGRPGRSGSRRAVQADLHERARGARRHLRKARPQRARAGARASRGSAREPRGARDPTQHLRPRVGRAGQDAPAARRRARAGARSCRGARSGGRRAGRAVRQRAVLRQRRPGRDRRRRLGRAAGRAAPVALALPLGRALGLR